jgi:tetratricopeptide (TPR) repeat protein
VSVASILERPRAAGLAAAAAAVVVYLSALGNGFAYDDVHIIQENPGIQQLETLPHALTIPYWPGEYGAQLGLWRPTTTLLLGLQYAAVGEDPLLYHAVNVAGHAAATFLVVLLVAGLLTVPAALAGGLVFAVHPVHVEAVANVIGIAEVASTVFFLAACLVVLRAPDRIGWRRSLAVGGLYLLAFGAKESAVTLPGAVFLLDAARRRIGFGDLPAYLRDRWRVYATMLGAAGLLLALRFRILGSIANPYGPLGADLLEEIPRIWTLAEVWSHYVRLMVFPLDLSSDYSPDVIPVSLGWNAANLVGLLLALAILAGSLAAWRRGRLGPGSTSARAAAFGVVWFLVTISPVSNVLFLTGILLAERTLYLPSVGIAVALGWMVVRLARERRRLAWAGLAVVLVLMGARTWERNPTWKSTYTVFMTLIEDYPHSGRSQWVLGDLFFQQGRPGQGLLSYRAAIDILGPHYQLITEISKKLIGAEYFRAAQHLLEYAWAAEPELPVAPGLIAVVRSELGDAEGTERWSRRALALFPDDPVRHHLLAWALAEQGRWKEAAVARRATIDHGEGEWWQQWVSLAYLEIHSGDTVAARTALDSARVKAVTTPAARQVDSLYADLLGASGGAAGPAHAGPATPAERPSGPDPGLDGGG